MLKKFQGFILYILIAGFVVALYLDHHTLLEKWDLKISDQMFRLRGSQSVGQEVVLVTIDSRAADFLGHYPWSRERWAGILNALSLYHPRVITLDLIQPLVDETDTTARGMYLLAEVLERNKNVVAPFTFSPAGEVSSASTAPVYLTRHALSSIDFEDNFKSRMAVPARALTYPDRWFLEKAAGAGHNSQTVDIDAKVRWHPLLVNFEGSYYPALALTAARLFWGLDLTQLKMIPGKGVKLGNTLIPTDSKGHLFVNYSGPSGSFKTFALSEVLEGKIDPNGLAGKVVILSQPSFGLARTFATPVDGSLPQAELTANLVENIIHHHFIKTSSLSRMLDLFILIMIGVLAAVILPQVSLAYRLIILGVFLVALLNLCFILFSSFGVLTKTFYPVLELLCFIGACPVLKPKRQEQEAQATGYAPVYRDQELESTTHLGEKPEEAKSEEQTEAIASREGLPTPEVFTRTEAVSEPDIIAVGQTLYEHISPTPKMPPPQPADKPKMLGRYEILEVLGKGAMGTVYKGLDPAIDRLVALKTIRLDAVANEDEIQELKERLVREAKAAGKLSHPNIVTIYDVGHEGDLQYIAMEYLEGFTLEEIIKRKVDLNYKIVAKLTVQACDALDYAHDRGIVHRDIKPANIMVLNNFQVKVMDFGIARLETSSSMTQTGIAMGTPNYISPEQLQGLPVDRRSDIFALGVVLYEFLTREKPFRGENLSQLIYNIINHNPPPVVEKNENIPVVLNRVTMRAISKDPLQRYQRAGDLAADLKEFLAAFQFGPSKPTPKPQLQA